MTNQINNILVVQDLVVRFGGILALNKVNFAVEAGSITALIGPNGAGKTTVFNCVTGFYRANGGTIRFRSSDKSLDVGSVLGETIAVRDIVHPPALLKKIYFNFFGGSFLVARAGIARTFQNIRLFRDMTVIENLLVAQHNQVDRGLATGVFGLPVFRSKESQAFKQAQHWLEVVGLQDFGSRLAGELSYGQQRRLEIARAMCTQPSLVCLDEPAAGLNPKETDDLAAMIRRLRDQFKVTVLVIEHDMSLIMAISDRVVVLNYGQVIAQGTPAEVQDNPAVLTAYLGEDYQTLEGKG